MQTSPILGTTLLALLLAPALRADIGYQFATVGNPGNAADSTGYGSVGYTYAVGTYDVTLTQYTAFLNAVAATDTYSLYNPQMGTDWRIAGIAQNGTSGNYSYSVIGSGQRPVTDVSWFDAARFTNWLSNGQPIGIGEVAASTEQGAYTLNGDTTNGLETKNANAQYWIPSENEWYKAAYYDPNKGGPGVGGYWTFATKSNSAPGNTVGNTPNQANYYRNDTGYTTGGVNGYLTDVGAFTGSASAYGTYDQSGEVWQWNDAVVGKYLRGGSWGGSGDASYMDSSYRKNSNSTFENEDVGFRVATIPEPSVAVSFILAGSLLLARRRRPV